MAGKGDAARRSHTKKSKPKEVAPASAKAPAVETGKSDAQVPPPAKPAAMKSKFCLNCQKDLARNIRITCTECRPQPPFELCVECFAVGVELGEHKQSHKYSVSDCLAFPIVHERQTAESAAAAPAAVGTNAAAIPTAISDAANAVWTADEELLLLEGIEMFGMGNWKDIAEHVVSKSDKRCERHYLTSYLGHKDLMPKFIGDVVEESKEEVQKQQMTTEEKAAEMNATSDQLMQRGGPPGERNGPSQLAGYMPLRGDFDVEYDNEAEVIMADMEFSDADHPAERELKLKVIQIYNQKLANRIERKKFVVERGLLDYKLHQHTERKRPKEERELLAQVRPFARFQTPGEHEKFVEGLIAAMRLKKQILLLQEYRKNGVRTLAEAELYDAEKKKRELDQAIQKQRESASYLYESGRTSSSGRDRANRWQNREQGVNGDAGGDSSRTRNGLNAIAATFSIEGTPGCHLLTPKEKELCCKLKLLPKHYLVIKDALVRECFRLGYLTKKMAKETVQIDVSKTGQVYDFFVKCGWVKSENATTTVSPSLKTKSPKKAKKAEVIAKEEQSVTPAKRKAAEMEAGTKFANSKMGNILEEIAAQRRLDVEAAKQVVTPEQLVKKIESTESVYGSALRVLDRLNAPVKEGWSDVALAAEFKRASPSKGDIATGLNLCEQVKSYADAGASMISVLTEPKWFKGSLEDMMAAREVVESMSARPAILRKDFIIDVYQLLEARAYGADCVLLIVALLSQEQLVELIDATHNLGMCALVEVNSVEELDIALAARSRLIGVNNRDLRSFKVDMSTTARVADAIRERGLSLSRDGVTLFALSGIRSHADVVKYEKCGARGILVGEYLMKSGDVATTVKDLLQAVTRHNELGDLPLLPPLAKVCGVTKVEYALAALRNGANMIGIIMAEHSPRYVQVEQAKAIAQAVREYGERTGPILPEVLEAHLDGQNDWFHRNVLALREACSRAPLVVGVFANKTAAEMNAAAEEIGLDLVQLHGDEGFEICNDIKYPTIRALHLPDTTLSDGVDAEAILQQVQEGLANYILLDTTMKGQQGGTGVAFDWKIAAIFTHARIPCLMAGGLTPENVVKALSVGHPVGVDVSSGVEVKGSPGVKDLDKVTAFLRAVKDYLSIAALKIDEEKET
ncbi:hypothetical protein PRNP1_008149 [Phytophthora ramorum]